jgi:hypothetical protein
MQSIESKNTNILNRFESKLLSTNITAFHVSVGGDSMNYLSQICKTKDEALIQLAKTHTNQEVIFLD